VRTGFGKHPARTAQPQQAEELTHGPAAVGYCLHWNLRQDPRPRSLVGSPQMTPTLRLVALLAGVAVIPLPELPQQALWQADLQIRSLTVTEVHGRLSARVVVGSEFGEAMATRVEVLLPVGVGLLETAAGCAASPSPPGVSALRARVICVLGNLPAHSSRAFQVLTTIPPNGVTRGFGVVAVSDTPDPRPGNNFAEKAIP